MVGTGFLRLNRGLNPCGRSALRPVVRARRVFRDCRQREIQSHLHPGQESQEGAMEGRSRPPVAHELEPEHTES